MADSNCLHCKMTELVNAHFRELQNLPADASPHVSGHAVIDAIAQLMGDIQSHAESPATRFAMIRQFLGTAEATRQAVVEHKNAQNGGRAGAPLQ